MISESLQKLLHLQELDQLIHQHETEIAHLNAKIEEGKKSREKRRAALQRITNEKEAAALARKKAEDDLKTREEQLKRFAAQSERITTPKELEALNHQIQRVQEEVSALEEQILGGMDQEERLEKDLRDKGAAGAKLDADSLTHEKQFDTLRAEKQHMLAGLREDRIVAANALDEDLRGTYQWIVSKHGLTAVVPLVGESCGACGGMVVPNLALAVREGKSLQKCNHCQRFLYARPM